MASTNKTPHYDLSQYVSSDKPTYLVDYNGDMAKIDTGINAAKTTADTASTAATNAQTAAETAQTTANTAVTNAATADTKATTANTSIGTLANLHTTEKTNLVGAINEAFDLAGTSEVVNTLSGSETDKAPSVSAVKTEVLGTILYNNQSGTTGTVNLSSSIANFDYIEIIYCDNELTHRGSTGKVESPNGKTLCLDYDVFVAGGPVVYSKRANVNVDNSQITFAANYEYHFGNDSNVFIDNTGVAIKIIEVIGYKK